MTITEPYSDPYGTTFLTRHVPDERLPDHGMPAIDAMRLVGEELIADGIPMRNLATFVTTWMEPDAQRLIAENLHRNFIDHAEYPRTADIEPHVDENTIGVAAVLGTTFTGHADDVAGINDMLVGLKHERGLDVPLHVDGASGGFVWPFLYPDTLWDFRLEQVRSINVSGHKYGLVYPGLGWLVFREPSDLPDDLVFYENYLGKRDATFTLNFSTGSAMVLAQYYNFLRYGHEGYRAIMETMQQNARGLADQIADMGPFRLIGGP